MSSSKVTPAASFTGHLLLTLDKSASIRWPGDGFAWMPWDLERKLSDSNGTNGHHMSCVFAREQAQTERLAALRRHDRMVFAKTPMVGPAEVLDHPSHHTHRMAVVNERLVALRAMRSARACVPTSTAANGWCTSPGTSS